VKEVPITERLPNQARVRFDIAQGLATGRGVIVDARYDDGWRYRLEEVEGRGLWTSSGTSGASCGPGTSR